MGSQSWQVQVRAGRVGSGFLVTDRHVITCAHVVAGEARAEIRLAQYPDLGGLEASVVVGADWDGRARDQGDLAVLELAEPVRVAPARFAAVDASVAPDSVKLTAYGFPRGFDEGILGEFRVTSDQLVAGEWIQLEAWSGHGQPLEEGFSGAAVVREDTGEVIGMVTARYQNGGGGRMLPSRALVRYWPGAADLVPVPDRPRQELVRLRDLLRRCEADCDPEREYRNAVGVLAPPPPVGGFRSLWDVAWFLLTEVAPAQGTAPWSVFAVRIADHAKDPVVGRALRAWAGDNGPGWAARKPMSPVPGNGPRWSPILVEVERSGSDRDAFVVSIFAITDGCAQLVASDTVAHRGVQGYVRERLDAAFRQIDHGGEELIAFALPRDWLGEPVDQWHTSPDDPTPLGCSSPVVLLDLGRRREARLRYKLGKAWEGLDGRSGTDWYRVECGTPQNPAKLKVRLEGTQAAVGYGAPPDTGPARGLLHAGLNAAIPVLVWPRTGCAGEEAQNGPAGHSCSGGDFLDSLVERLTALSASDLPRHVHQLRREAYLADDTDPHWASGLALVWDDPRWFPETPVYQQSPIS
ncbi:trypsin-like peptidase domain-containing protein [Kitasatospora sp. NPDC028055]|uniref:VMAP-C domain-containing protein n=1 Tax=Kitasatospora sp. NPDC028055 TaxID=3155653 RepID=UPI0033C8AA22